MRLVIIFVLILTLMVGMAGAATVSGFISDKSNGEALYGANVFLKDTRFGTITNEKGYYVLTGIPAGEYDLVFSYIGYRQRVESITLKADGDVTYTTELISEAIAMEEIEVYGEKSDLEITPSQISLRTVELKKVPQVAEADLFRAIQALPGVATLSDFSAGLYVRGGSADQNLILLDGIDVYNPNHLFGFFSTFNVDAVKTVELQKGGFPARYGGRLSALLNVHNRDGNRKEFQGAARLSVISSSVTLEGPWSKGSWMVSGRHTYIEQLAKLMNVNLPYKFYDVHGKFNYDISPSDRLSVSFYGGQDRLEWDEPSLNLVLDWGNRTGSIQWTHLFNSRLFSHFMLGGSRFKSDNIIAFQDIDFKAINQIDDISLKGNLSYTPNVSHLIDFGFETKFLDFTFKRTAGEDGLNFGYKGVYGACYLQENWEINPLWQLQLGVRGNYYSEGDYFHLVPRISLQKRWSDTFTTHMTYGEYRQYLNLVSDGGVADSWFPVDNTLKPGKSEHFIFGFNIGPYSNFELEIEAYYKLYNRLVEFSEEFGNSIIDDDATLGEAFKSGDGDAYGFDVYLKNNWRGFEGWVGYTWGETKRKFDDYNFGEEYYPQYDRRHQIVTLQDLHLGRGWRFNFSFKYASGQPTTLATARYTVVDITGRQYDMALDGEKNAYRLPDYHRLDVGLFYLKEYKHWNIEPYVQVINVYNHENVYLRSYDTSVNPVEYDDITMLPLLPTVGVNINF